ncbi:HprK-related kinase A [Kordia sp. SMS9]|uniref:hypothetical protein n=1 Tax=Kordia sp. SMS9 TaxID=2282170 RepID=UPI000E0DCC75|nr:hypothetical protein [Kordia sp. SMS9]AXG70712.1 HprK-related kinase A [Kordia sp. SMS9]
MTQHITLHIADIYIHIESEINGVIGRFQEFYRHFSTNESAHSDYSIVIKQEKMTVSVTGEEEGFKFQGYAFKQFEKHAILLIPSLKNAYQYAEEFLLFIFSELCIQKNKLIFHSASLIDDQDNAYIFFGPSGIGKSTISRKLTDFTVFSDDMMVMEKTNNGYLLQKTPFERNKQRKPAVLVNIKVVFRLVQSDVVKINSLKKSNAFNVLLSNLWFSDYQKKQVEKYAEILQDLMQNTTVAELQIAKNSQKEAIVECIKNYEMTC